MNGYSSFLLIAPGKLRPVAKKKREVEVVWGRIAHQSLYSVPYVPAQRESKNAARTKERSTTVVAQTLLRSAQSAYLSLVDAVADNIVL